VVVDDDLIERDAGEWSGLTRAEIEAAWPGYLANADAHAAFGGRDHAQPPKRPPGWEPDDSVLARALAAIGRIHAAVPGGDILAVTHGGLVHMLERHLGAPFARLANLEGRWVAVDDDRITLGDRLLLVDPAAAPVTVPGQI
jgi:broad specificity phosphatase PhoE